METPGHLGASVWGHSSAAVLTGFLAPGASAPQRPPSAPPPQHPQWPGAPSAPLLGTPPGPPCAVPGAPVGTDRGLHGQNDGNGFSQGLEAGVHSPGVHQADLSCSPRKPPCCAASLVSAGPRQPPVSSAPSRAAAASGSVCSGLPSARLWARTSSPPRTPALAPGPTPIQYGLGSLGLLCTDSAPEYSRHRTAGGLEPVFVGATPFCPPRHPVVFCPKPTRLQVRLPMPEKS